MSNLRPFCLGAFTYRCSALPTYHINYVDKFTPNLQIIYSQVCFFLTETLVFSDEFYAVRWIIPLFMICTVTRGIASPKQVGGWGSHGCPAEKDVCAINFMYFGQLL